MHFNNTAWIKPELDRSRILKPSSVRVFSFRERPELLLPAPWQDGGKCLFVAAYGSGFDARASTDE